MMETNRAVQAKKIATVTFAAVTIFTILIFGGIFLWNWFQSKLLW
jgi:predicted negative regulator of RcsB-dependent stress response